MGEPERKDAAMNVVMVGPKTFPPDIGGIETHVYEISKRLVSRGHHVTVIVPGTSCRRTEGAVEGVHVVKVPSLEDRRALKLSMIPSVMKELKRTRGCVVHAHDATGGFAAALASDNRRFVYTMHGLGFHRSDWPTPFRQGIRMMQTKALSSAAHVFCTDDLASTAAKKVREQVEVLSSGIDVSDFSGADTARPPEYPQGSFVVLYVGRLAKVKGVDVLLKAIESIPEREMEGLIFTFIGDGPMKADVQKAARTFSNIKFVGPIVHSRIAPYFRHANAFVLPSVSEGLPISLLEAMASGLPAIATDVGGVARQMDPKTISLVQPGDSAGLAHAILDIHSDKKKAEALGRGSRAFVAEHFSWDRVVQRIEEVYGSISSP